MVELDTKQIRIYTVAGSQRIPNRVYIHNNFVSSSTLNCKVSRFFTSFHHSLAYQINKTKIFIINILFKVKGYFKTHTTKYEDFGTFCDTHIWSNKMESLRRLCDGGDK